MIVVLAVAVAVEVVNKVEVTEQVEGGGGAVDVKSSLLVVFKVEIGWSSENVGDGVVDLAGGVVGVGSGAIVLGGSAEEVILPGGGADDVKVEGVLEGAGGGESINAGVELEEGDAEGVEVEFVFQLGVELAEGVEKLGELDGVMESLDRTELA